MNQTHDPQLRSWVASAQAPGTDFPIQNLPFGVFERNDRQHAPRVGVAIGDQVLDVTACLEHGLFSSGLAEAAARACAHDTLNSLMRLGPDAWSALRSELSAVLREGAAAAHKDASQHAADHLTPMAEATLRRPVHIGDYTDFYASVYHATNVGSMFRPDNPLLPNYKHVPIGYHGRASSIVPSNTPVRRPHGQTKAPDAEAPLFGPSKMLDYESELGCFIGVGNPLGAPVAVDDASRHIFGFCLVNDWSARDIQAWEYQPLGPFLAKNFATTISPWIVTAEALEPYRTAAFVRPAGDPAPLPYLSSPAESEQGGLAITLDVLLTSQQMRSQAVPPMLVSRSSFTDMYWTVGQMVAHHTSNGCNLQPGDLLASGTVSGNTPESRGCLLERTWRGAEPLTLPTGEQRKFLHDGDEVIMRGACQRDGYARIGFGECRGTILPAQ